MEKAIINTRGNTSFLVEHNQNVFGGIQREYRLTRDAGVWTVEEMQHYLIDRCEFRVIDSFPHTTEFPITALKFWIQTKRMEHMLQYGKTDWLPVTNTKQIGIITNERITTPVIAKSDDYRNDSAVPAKVFANANRTCKNVQHRPTSCQSNDQNQPVSNNQQQHTSQDNKGDINEVFSHIGSNTSTASTDRQSTKWWESVSKSRSTGENQRCELQGCTMEEGSRQAYFREQATKKRKYGVTRVVSRVKTKRRLNNSVRI